MKRNIVYCIFILIVLIVPGCTNEPRVELFEGTGQYWSATIKPEIKTTNGTDYFVIKYNYKGKLEDIKKIQRITFSQGTALGTEIVSVFDQALNEKLMKEGNNKEEQEQNYGIIVKDLKNMNTTEIEIEYYLMGDEEHNTFDSIEQDRIYIQISWEIDEKEYTDEITIYGSR